ncbi:MAG: 4-(cytidine 5'-diphospho)-2-C-methyl-D-erythritol kinase [Chloroflexi bacterium]|nr:4-(cytidine 5'-diphospho)-2-C-methyl-D-erythritol kinase [Chloroflexota bacterium]
MHLRTSAHAKVNLALAVTGRRADGYHTLCSVFVRVGLADRLGVSLPEPPMVADHVVVAGDLGCPTEDNLVLHAAASLRASAEDALPGLAFALDKAIPMGAGLGGGSSDAAAALRLAAEIWGLTVPADELGPIASALGADVPFFVADAPAALVAGVGDDIEPLSAPTGPMGLLLVCPAFRLSTAEVFAASDQRPIVSDDSRETSEALAQALREGLNGAELASASWIERLADANDLWPAAAAVAPDLAVAREEVERALGRRLLMTGSGSTLVGLYPSTEEATDAGRRLASALPSSLDGARLLSVDLVGPDPHWSHP